MNPFPFYFSLRSKLFRRLLPPVWGIFCFLAARKLGRAQIMEGSSGEEEDRRQKETLARKPHDFEKRPFDTFPVK